ncbi:MAG TPA: hypothetical protein VEA41_01340 [Salinarimonas sp.]|nr:hypothetical protein [Salinarimonas sp.]
MLYLVVAAIIGILILHGTGAIPMSGVGGAMVIGFAYLIGVTAVGIYDAWTRRRSWLGWIVSLVVAHAAAMLLAPFGGMIVVLLLSPFMDASSLAATGGVVLASGLAGGMAVTLLVGWGSLRLLDRWRLDRSTSKR